MTFDYFYGQQADLFSFYRVPKILFTDDRFWNVSTDAKLLYGILLDRMNLSAKNGWLDEQGRVYIIFTIEEIQAAFNCGDKKPPSSSVSWKVNADSSRENAKDSESPT